MAARSPTGTRARRSTLTIDSFQVNSACYSRYQRGQAGGGTFDTTVGNITSLAPLQGTTATSTVNVIGGNTLTAASATTSTYVMSVQGTSTWDYNGERGRAKSAVYRAAVLSPIAVLPRH